MQQAIVAKMAQLPAVLRRTLTWDQGSEMTNHIAVAEATQLDIYFCDPHSPWQRGSNENTNGLLRQYFAKGTDLSIFPADYLDYVALPNSTADHAKPCSWKTPGRSPRRTTLRSVQNHPLLHPPHETAPACRGLLRLLANG